MHCDRGNIYCDATSAREHRARVSPAGPRRGSRFPPVGARREAGVDLAVSTMCGWVRSSADLLSRVLDSMAEELRQDSFIQGDATGLPWTTTRPPSELRRRQVVAERREKW